MSQIQISTLLESLKPIHTKVEIQKSITEISLVLEKFYLSIHPEIYFSKPESGWSPEQNVKHLSKSTLPVLQFLNPYLRLTLKLLGPKRSTMNLEEIVDKYQSKLKSGSQAGFFSPFTRTEKADIKKQEKQIIHLKRICEDIVQNLGYWTEEKLDSYPILHPILGRISMREMLFFTIYHLCHHSEIVEKRLIKIENR